MMAAPLRERVYVGDLGQSVSDLSDHDRSLLPSRPCNYKLWDEKSMMSAIKAVIDHGMSIRGAAEFYGVPKSTLGDRISGRVLPGSKSGPDTHLTSEEEEELAGFLCRTALIGHARTRKEVLAIVNRILSSRGKKKEVTPGWWASFVARHPKLTLRTPATLSLSRANATDPQVINTYFDELEMTLEENGLTDKPCQIFNMDETGMPLDPSPLKVVTWKGHKNPAQVSSGSKAQVTVVGCVSAGGQCLPPMVIWDRKRLPPELAVGEVPGTIYGLSAKGWIDQELFDLWFTQHFLRYAPLARPLLLLMDGHSSHYCPSTVKTAAKEKVILFTLPPNTTHLTQPLDKSVFGPLKVQWRQVCHRYIVEHPGARITKHNFSIVFSEAWILSMTPRNIVSGFRTTGVWPINRNAIVLPMDPSNLAAKSGVAYIPMFTPAKRRLSSVHSSDSPVSDKYVPAEKHAPLASYLDSPNYRRIAVTHTKSSIRVLTSAENLQRIEHKEKEKQAKQQEKEERARRREERRGLQKGQGSQKRVAPFSVEELVMFNTRYENGYDLSTDSRYNEWLAQYHPQNGNEYSVLCTLQTVCVCVYVIYYVVLHI